jgi:hypothetical protein
VPGTRRQSLTLLAGIVAIAWPAAAHAYHVGSMFDAAPGAGGAGGLYYTGSTRDRGWDCTSCHVAPRKQLDVTVTSQPPELISEASYRPGTAYVITVALANPTAQLGLPATRSNFNTLAITTLDLAGAPVGVFSGYDAGRFHARGTSFLASETSVVNETSWSFTWTAPPAGVGSVAIDLGVVDGNGAGVTSQTTLTDPLGDDTAMFHYVVSDGASATLAPPARSARWAWLLLAPVLALCFPLCRSRSSAPASSG